MKEKIHPKYSKSTVKCACGTAFETRSTKPEILVEICASCHPFYTGKKKLVDTTGRVERFEKLLSKKKPKTAKAKKSKTGKKEAKAVSAKKPETAEAKKEAVTAHSTDSTSSPQANSRQEAKK